MPDSYFAIVNPSAASYLAGNKWKHICEYFKKDARLEYRLTEYRFHARELAREAVASGTRNLISVGGDGTFNEILNGMMNSGIGSDKLPTLGIISVGTGSDFCRTFGIPADFHKAVDIIKEGESVAVDIGRVNFRHRSRKWLRYFANVFDVGLGGSVVRIANGLPKNLGGSLTFLVSSLAGLITHRPRRMQIFVDGKFVDGGNMTIAGIANGRYFGGGMKIAPMARIDDGIFEVLYVKDTNLLKFIQKVLLPVYEAGHLKYRNTFHHHGRHVVIKGDTTLLADIDGEEERADEVEVTIVPRAIRIKAPRMRYAPG